MAATSMTPASTRLGGCLGILEFGMIIRPKPDILSSEITPETLYHSRRDFLATMGAAAVGALLPPVTARYRSQDPGEKLTPFDDITTYNNFYEFGLQKDDPSKNAHTLRTRPWTVAVEGDVRKPKTFDIDDLIKRFPQEERVYRLRCVEAWSMVIPWQGFPLSKLLDLVQPTSNARYVSF